jgi:hypothetical protein
MAEDDKTAPIAPVSVAVVGSLPTMMTGTGTGSPLTTGTVGTTPDHQPNIVLNVITPVVAITVRAVTLFLTTFSAALAVAGVGGKDVLPVADMQHAINLAMWMGLSAAGVGTVKNLITIFSGLEGKYPLGTGSI